MSDKNKRRGVPRVFFPHLVKWKFPQERPIFWAGEQDTNFPDVYSEPGQPKDNLLKIPVAIRFVVSPSVPINVDRVIYLGMMPTIPLAMERINTDCDPITFGLLATWSKRFTFQTGTEISSEYGANVTSEQAVGLYTETVTCIKPYFSFIVDQFQKGTEGWYETKLTYFCPPDDVTEHHIAQYWDEPIGIIGNFGPDPFTFAAPFNSITFFNNLVANPNKLYTELNYKGGFHFYLHNIISGSFQINLLSIVFLEGDGTETLLTAPLPKPTGVYFYEFVVTPLDTIVLQP